MIEDFISVTNLMRKFLFIHIILQPATCFEQYYAHPQEVTLYTCSIWYPHSLWAVVVFVRLSENIKLWWVKAFGILIFFIQCIRIQLLRFETPNLLVTINQHTTELVWCNIVNVTKLVFGGSNCNNWIIMHWMQNVEFNAQQAKRI
jgi:hypothetical protein